MERMSLTCQDNCGCLFVIVFSVCAIVELLSLDLQYDPLMPVCDLDNVLYQSSSNDEISVSAPCDFAIAVCVLDNGTHQSSSNFAILQVLLKLVYVTLIVLLKAFEYAMNMECVS